MRVLVVEDEPKLQKLLRRGLAEEGFTVEVVSDGQEGLFRATTEAYDALVLDLMVPCVPGLKILGMLRKEGKHTPVLILTARDSEQDKIQGLNLGADDYMTKPFSLAELVARLRALIRRTHQVATSVIAVADLKIDAAARRVTRGGREIQLPAKEFALLEFLALNVGKLITRTQIYEHIYEYESDTLSNVADVHMYRLRKAIDRGFKDVLIHTVRGQGYVLKEPE